MISYKPLWITMEQKHITTYALIHKYGIDAHTISSLKHDKSITMNTLETLCQILDCSPSEVVQFLPEEPE